MLILSILCCHHHLVAQSSGINQPYVDVPFDLIHGAIVIEASINGFGPFWMMLDTGADPSVVDIKTAKKIGLKLAAHGQPASGGGTEVNLAYETVLPSVQLGKLTATRVDALGMDLSKISTA